VAPSYTLSSSQSRYGPRVQALINCMEDGIPVVLLAGRKYEGTPFLSSLRSCRYAVLGYYWVTCVWVRIFYVSSKPG
jgi:hypothetical protein